MLRFLATSAACLALCAAAAAQDRSGPATITPPDLGQPVAARPDTPPPSPESGGGALGSLALRSAEPDATQTVADLKPSSGAPKPWCAQERRVGTGAGFCLVN
ncbi:hypothetical protein ACRAWG_27410 [Methylobacterium sp. P31]